MIVNFTAALVIATSLNQYALTDFDTLTSPEDSLSIVYDLPDTAEIEEAFDANVDSMLNLYYVKEGLTNNPGTSDIVVIPSFPDSVYRERLEKLPTVAEMTYNNIVKRYIEVYTVRNRKSVEVMLGLSEHYFPIFDEIFDYYGVPNEMKYMSIIESALNPRASSRARAVGLWQFMYGTGRIYGLEINSLVDERRDPIKSTYAAAKYIRDLNDRYDDWLLALAAYNCGPGNVNKAIRRSGGKRDFWEIYYYLPKETRGHVPAFIAATYTMNYYKEHNLTPAKIDLPILADTVMINQKLHLKQVSEVLNIPLKQLEDLNPQYQYDIIPGNIKPYSLRLPMDQAIAFIDAQDSIYSFKDSVFFNSPVAKASTPAYSYDIPEAPGADFTKLTYTVKSGDAIGLIADWYDVRITDLKYWNNIHKNMIRAGQKLTIYKSKSVASKYKEIETLSFAQKQSKNGNVLTTPATTANITPTSTFQPNNSKSEGFIIYTVRSGDTIWDIAQQFPGVTDTEIMRWNNITSASKIQPGQKLKIKPKS